MSSTPSTTEPARRELRPESLGLPAPVFSIATAARASTRDVPRIATTLARAFHDDPVFRWMVPDDERRDALLPRFFALVTETMSSHGEIHVAAEGAGAALWAPPGRLAVPEPDAGEFGRRLEEMTAEADAERVLGISTLLDEHHPPGSYWFLQFLGVEPAGQGRGIGSTLLSRVVERCDREGARAYLDATSPASKRLYERHGFRAGDAYAPDGCPPLWPMWREPAASA